MDTIKTVLKNILNVASFGILIGIFLAGCISLAGMQVALLPNIQIETYDFDDEDNESDKLHSSLVSKSRKNNSIYISNKLINLRELFQTRKFWFSSFHPRPPPKSL